LAVAYNIENPILAANIGAATPAIIMALTRDPVTKTSHASLGPPPPSRRPAHVRPRRP
jgi:hypothetical protein